MIAIRGIHSRIAEELIKLLPEDEIAHEIPRGMIGVVGATRYVFLQGLLRPKAIWNQPSAESAQAWKVNASEIIQACDLLIENVPQVRIVVIGSESGFTGSFDFSYAGAKAALHLYVETKKLKSPFQQLVCVSPGIIGDAGMTTRRVDQHNVETRKKLHPKERLIDSVEVARLIHFLLYVDRGYICNTVIRMNGGEHIK